MSKPYGENEGDIWTGLGSDVQARLDETNSNQVLIHEMARRGDDVEELLFVTEDVGLIARAKEGDKILGTVLCPRCERERYTPYGSTTEATYAFSLPALSRTDNATHICTPCGQDEAMRDFTKEPPIPPDEWPIGMREAGEFGMGGRWA